jgi:hypothetical protein
VHNNICYAGQKNLLIGHNFADIAQSFLVANFSHWRHYPHGQSISKDLPQLLVYKHPNIPSVNQSQLPVLNSTNYF